MKIKQMKTNNLIKIAMFSLLLLIGNFAMAQTTISGSITDSENLKNLRKYVRITIFQ